MNRNSDFIYAAGLGSIDALNLKATVFKLTAGYGETIVNNY